MRRNEIWRGVARILEGGNDDVLEMVTRIDFVLDTLLAATTAVNEVKESPRQKDRSP